MCVRGVFVPVCEGYSCVRGVFVPVCERYLCVCKRVIRTSV